MVVGVRIGSGVQHSDLLGHSKSDVLSIFQIIKSDPIPIGLVKPRSEQVIYPVPSQLVNPHILFLQPLSKPLKPRPKLACTCRRHKIVSSEWRSQLGDELLLSESVDLIDSSHNARGAILASATNHKCGKANLNESVKLHTGCPLAQQPMMSRNPPTQVDLDVLPHGASFYAHARRVTSPAFCGLLATDGPQFSDSR